MPLTLKNFYRQWWKPWANTIAYFPFQTDKNNTISWWPTLSSSWATITTLDWVNCLYFDGTNLQAIDKWFRTTDITSWMCWIYGYSGVIMEQRSTAWWNSDRILWISNWSFEYLRYQNSSAHITWPSISNNQWHCIGFTEDSSWGKIFLDSNPSAVWTNSSIRDFSNLTTNTWIGCRMDNGNLSSGATWYLAQLVLMDSSITIDDFLDFYNQTKSLYWIS